LAIIICVSKLEAAGLRSEFRFHASEVLKVLKKIMERKKCTKMKDKTHQKCNKI